MTRNKNAADQNSGPYRRAATSTGPDDLLVGPHHVLTVAASLQRRPSDATAIPLTVYHNRVANRKNIPLLATRMRFLSLKVETRIE
ncbi:MAG: hypothetical protein GXP27_04300 [Planctomycetes bacterium]|nr:hypothetical protein [Planctomycetota bacterium]